MLRWCTFSEIKFKTMKFETEVRIKFESAFRLNWSFVHIETMSFFPRQFLTYKFVMESMRLVFHGSFFFCFFEILNHKMYLNNPLFGLIYGWIPINNSQCHRLYKQILKSIENGFLESIQSFALKKVYNFDCSEII